MTIENEINRLQSELEQAKDIMTEMLCALSREHRGKLREELIQEAWEKMVVFVQNETK